jgi:hypothetical protein
MATYTNTIIIKSNAFNNAAALLKALDVESFSNTPSTKKISDENIDYNNSLDDDGLAVGFWKGFIILTGRRVTELIYDSVCQRFGSKFKKIEQLFPTLDALLTFSNDTEMSFVFELILNNKSIRKKQVYHGKSQESNDIGELLPYEYNYYSQLCDRDKAALKQLNEYKSGNNDTNVSLSIIEYFCGEMPDFDNLKMNVGIERDLGKDVIEILNESFGDEKEKLKKIVSCINDGVKPLKLRLEKYKQIPKLIQTLSCHQPGCILKEYENLKIVFRPIITCSYKVSVEIRLEIQFLNSDELIITTSELPNQFNFQCFLADHITVKKDFDTLLLNLKAHINDFFIPILKCSDKSIYEIILKYGFSEQYFNLIILEAEKNKRKRSSAYPYMYRFDSFVQLLELKNILGLDGSQKVLKLFSDYLRQYKSIFEYFPELKDSLPKIKYNNFVKLFDVD